MAFRANAAVLLCLVLVAALAAPRFAHADGGPSLGHDVRSVFVVSKSENRNEVHYGVRVDADCRAAGEAPVYAYWLLKERSGVVEGLLDIEQAAYGIAAGQVTARSESGSVVSMRLRALPQRRIEVATWRSQGRCFARARMRILATDAWVDDIYAKLGWPFGVEAIQVRGVRVGDEAHVVEWVQP